MTSSRVDRDIPFAIDYRIFGSLLDRMAWSTLVRHQLRGHVINLKMLPPKATICAFGSVARGEMDTLYSDIDLMFLGVQSRQRTNILRNLLAGHQGLDFDHAERFVDAQDAVSVERLELRFPALVESQLLESNSEISLRRRVQFITEAVCVVGDNYFEDLTEQVVNFYGLIPRRKRRQNPHKFLEDLNTYYSNMLDVSAQKEASSNFHAKYLLAREIGQHFTRLAVLVAVFSKDAILMTPRPALAYARILRQPALHKLLFWVTPFFLSGNTMSVLKSAHTTSLRKISRDIDQLLFETVAECAKTYSDALDILHEPDMREHLNQESANILNWRSDPDLKLFNNQVSIIAQSLQKLGKILGNIFLLADEKRVFRRPYAESGLQVAMKNFQDGVKSSLN